MLIMRFSSWVTGIVTRTNSTSMYLGTRSLVSLLVSIWPFSLLSFPCLWPFTLHLVWLELGPYLGPCERAWAFKQFIFFSPTPGFFINFHFSCHEVTHRWISQTSLIEVYANREVACGPPIVTILFWLLILLHCLVNHIYIIELGF